MSRTFSRIINNCIVLYQERIAACAVVEAERTAVNTAFATPQTNNIELTELTRSDFPFTIHALTQHKMKMIQKVRSKQENEENLSILIGITVRGFARSTLLKLKMSVKKANKSTHLFKIKYIIMTKYMGIGLPLNLSTKKMSVKKANKSTHLF